MERCKLGRFKVDITAYGNFVCLPTCSFRQSNGLGSFCVQHLMPPLPRGAGCDTAFQPM